DFQRALADDPKAYEMIANRSLYGMCVASIAAIALTMRLPSVPGRSPLPELFDSAPKLDAPTGGVTRVSPEQQLQAAVAALRSGETILIAPGIYRLSKTVYVGGRELKNIAI